jgi:hypothetical protein
MTHLPLRRQIHGSTRTAQHAPIRQRRSRARLLPCASSSQRRDRSRRRLGRARGISHGAMTLLPSRESRRGECRHRHSRSGRGAGVSGGVDFASASHGSGPLPVAAPALRASAARSTPKATPGRHQAGPSWPLAGARARGFKTARAARRRRRSPRPAATASPWEAVAACEDMSSTAECGQDRFCSTTDSG